MRTRTLAVRMSLTLALVVAALAVCQAVFAYTFLDALTLRNDQAQLNGDGSYTFMYSVWGKANFPTQGTISYMDLAVCPWGNYSNYIRYSPRHSSEYTNGVGDPVYSLATYPGFVGSEYDYWDRVLGDNPTTPKPYHMSQSDDPVQNNDPGWKKSGKWLDMRTWSTINGVNASTNNDKNAPYGDNPGTPDVFQGRTPSGYAADPNAPIWLGGFQFTASHVSVGMVPYAIWSTEGNNLLGQGEVLGPTPEASTLILLGVTGLPFISNRLRRRRRQAAEG